MSGDNAGKAYHETSVFIAENLLREARRQRGLGDEPVPDVCVLDPGGGFGFEGGGVVGEVAVAQRELSGRDGCKAGSARESLAFLNGV